MGDLVRVARCGVICGAQRWVAIEQFGQAKADWVATCLDLPPWHARARPRWPGAPTWMRRTARRAQPGAGHAARHLVSAWATAPRLVLGPGVGDSPSNEITAEPPQQRPRALTGCLVTSDALGCQRASAAQLLEQETTAKCGSKAKRLHAGGSHDYLLQVRAG